MYGNHGLSSQILFYDSFYRAGIVLMIAEISHWLKCQLYLKQNLQRKKQLLNASMIIKNKSQIYNAW